MVRTYVRVCWIPSAEEAGVAAKSLGEDGAPSWYTTAPSSTATSPTRTNNSFILLRKRFNCFFVFFLIFFFTFWPDVFYN
jgi:hypothetical protein